jgi:hypothetical protein
VVKPHVTWRDCPSKDHSKSLSLEELLSLVMSVKGCLFMSTLNQNVKSGLMCDHIPSEDEMILGAETLT